MYCIQIRIKRTLLVTTWAFDLLELDALVFFRHATHSGAVILLVILGKKDDNSNPAIQISIKLCVHAHNAVQCPL